MIARLDEDSDFLPQWRNGATFKDHKN